MHVLNPHALWKKRTDDPVSLARHTPAGGQKQRHLHVLDPHTLCKDHKDKGNIVSLLPLCPCPGRSRRPAGTAHAALMTDKKKGRERERRGDVAHCAMFGAVWRGVEGTEASWQSNRTNVIGPKKNPKRGSNTTHTQQP